MATIGYADLPVPGGGDGPDGAAALAALAEALDPHLVQHVANLAERNSTMSDAPTGMLVIAADGTTWAKTASGWATLYEPLQPWQSTISLKSGFEEGIVDLGVRLTDGGKHVWLKGRIQRTDGQLIYDANAVNLGSVPSSLTPAELRTFDGTCSMGGATTDATGRLEILNTGVTSAYGVAGDILWWYQGTDGTAWVDISGDYWLD
ncbi:hypothetical protein DCW30_05925 [Streptomyces alfalfae]|uniref:Phage tail protein n=1 Tax=Streptomyces alfalfae TaxID=1642299 RepID=A0ABM6GVP3_9ACTN|nr:hypothetical protein [Streptomyces alfalfae]APY88165.1 hypothetical protein A7J05_22950 [Streptomyces alfalfae]AYA18558.1 hypothetical protein D3X13_22060 [Streptomyces fradiae]RXX46561.1 hypothetical protein DCW30_05925 [Streptomyces alfalfae]RZM90074.1 hypothetical protein D4104_25860 [Streptomyces alfalfae]